MNIDSPHPPLAVALLGCGAVARQCHGPALEALERAGVLRVAALYDPASEALETLAQRFPKARCLGPSLSLEGLDIAIVASPPTYHAAQTILALEAGLTVLCEKPMATTVVDAEAMQAAATAAGKPLAIGFVRRFFPATRAIHSVLAGGMLGNLLHLDVFEGGGFQWPTSSTSYFDRETAGGGVLSDVGVHVLDLITWWLGEPLEFVYADDAMGGVEANSLLRLTFREGTTARIRLSRDWGLPNRYVLHGSEGWISWTAHDVDQIQMGLHESGLSFDARLGETGISFGQPMPRAPDFRYEQCYKDQLLNVVAAARGEAPLTVTGDAGVRSLRLVEKCYQDRSLLPMPWLSEQEQERAHQLREKK